MEDNLNHAIKMFRHYDCDEQVLVSRSKLAEILNKQSQTNLKHPFNTLILDEIWGQAQTTSKGQSTTYTFSKIYIQAMSILQQRINMIEGPNGISRKQNQLISQQTKLQQLQQLYQEGYSENYDRINTARKNIVTLENKMKELQKHRDNFKKELQQMKKCLIVEQKERHHPIQKSQYAQSIFKEQYQLTKASTPSPHLSLIFKLTFSALCFQMLFFTFHFSFLSLLCYFCIFSWLFLGYYDQYFVKTIITGLSLSCCLDIAYIYLQSTNKINTDLYDESHRGWIYATIIILIIQIILRVFIILKLFMFRQPNAKRQYFVLFNHQIQLNSRSGKIFMSHNVHD